MHTKTWSFKLTLQASRDQKKSETTKDDSDKKLSKLRRKEYARTLKLLKLNTNELQQVQLSTKVTGS